MDYLTSEEHFNALSPASKALECYRTVPKIFYNKAAAMYKITKQTLINRDKGKTKSYREARKAVQRLIITEEEVIVEIALDLYNTGWPLFVEMVR